MTIMLRDVSRVDKDIIKVHNYEVIKQTLYSFVNIGLESC